MIKYQIFIEAAGSQAAVADSQEARRAVQAVLTAVALALDEPERARLRDALPGALRGAADVPGPATPVEGGAGLVRAVSEQTGCPAERARFYTHAVLATLGDAEPGLGELIAARLPDGRDLMAPIDQGVPPRGSGIPVELSPRILDPDEVAREMDRLHGWEGDEHRLRRTVVLPADRVPALRDAVNRAELEMNHHARVHEEQGSVTFEVWTHSLDRVTDMDLDLARRMDAAVDTVGAHG